MNTGRFDDGFAPTYWRRMRALNGHGQLLIGPDEYSDRPGAMVIAPPGVFLRAPIGREPLTRDGWRLACWRPDADGVVLVDQARPVGLVNVSLTHIVEDLAKWAPEHLTWVAKIVERQLRVLVGRMSRDCHGKFHPRAETAYRELVATRRSGDEAFGRLRNLPGKFPEWMVDSHFLRMQQQFVAELVADRERHLETIRAAGGLVEARSRHLRLVTDWDVPIDHDYRISD